MHVAPANAKRDRRTTGQMLSLSGALLRGRYKIWIYINIFIKLSPITSKGVKELGSKLWQSFFLIENALRE